MDRKLVRDIVAAGALALAPMLVLAPVATAQTGASPGGARAGNPAPGVTAEQTERGLVAGPSGLMGRMPMPELEQGLQQQGYSDYEVIEYTVRGMRNGQPVTFRVDAATGQVIE